MELRHCYYQSELAAAGLGVEAHKNRLRLDAMGPPFSPLFQLLDEAVSGML